MLARPSRPRRRLRAMHCGGGLDAAAPEWGPSAGYDYGGGGLDDASLAAAFGAFGFAPSGAEAGAAAMPYGVAGGGVPMSPRAELQDSYNNLQAELFADPHAASWLAGAYGGNFDPERLLGAEQLAEPRPSHSPGYHRRAGGSPHVASPRRRAPLGSRSSYRLAPHAA